MSDHRPRFATWRYPFAEIVGNKKLIIELFESSLWPIRSGRRAGKVIYLYPLKGVYPHPPEGEEPNEYWSGMYRLRINGCWYGPKAMSFFTMVQAAEIAEQILSTGSLGYIDHKLSVIGCMV